MRVLLQCTTTGTGVQLLSRVGRGLVQYSVVSGLGRDRQSDCRDRQRPLEKVRGSADLGKACWDEPLFARELGDAKAAGGEGHGKATELYTV